MKNYEEYTDEELVDRLHQGENEIMDYILEKYKPLVRKQTNALFLIGGENEDLIQEGMIGLFKAIRDYDDTKEATFFYFAQLCIKRQLASALEASNRKKHIPLNNYVSFSSEENDNGTALEATISQGVESPEQMVLEQEKVIEFKEQIRAKLSKMEKEVLNLYLEGYNYTQIAKIMEKTPKSIDNALQRIRQKIRGVLES
ncbi:MAG: sigma-70 family RNA polymerase sigma factor [Agathobacter sp.]|nr:sigma-70 family RNA polymerase sigma factor [Agathobacter sp.]